MTIIDRSLRMFVTGALVGIVIGLSSCSAAQRLEGSVVATETIADTFAATGDLMKLAHESGVVADDKWSAWCAFAKRFKLVFPAAAGLLKAAIEAASPDAADGATAILGGLKRELNGFEAMVISVPPDGGLQ